MNNVGQRYKYNIKKRIGTVIFYTIVFSIVMMFNLYMLVLALGLVKKSLAYLLVAIVFFLSITIALAFNIYIILEMINFEIVIMADGINYTNFIKQEKKYKFERIVPAFVSTKKEKRIEFFFSEKKSVQCVYEQMLDGKDLHKRITNLMNERVFLDGDLAIERVEKNKRRQIIEIIVIISFYVFSWLLTGVVL